MWPNNVTRNNKKWQAAAPRDSQIFMLFGIAVLIPMILAYTAWAYYVFRGKVDPHGGYHS
jgi:cytochrome d ubiquinol oxidase subunit II